MNHMNKYILVYSILNAGKNDVVMPEEGAFLRVFKAIFSNLSVKTIENWNWQDHSFHLSTWSPKVHLKRINISKYLPSNLRIQENKDTSLSIEYSMNCPEIPELQKAIKRKSSSQFKRHSKRQKVVSTCSSQANNDVISTIKHIDPVSCHSILKDKKSCKRKVSSNCQSISESPTKLLGTSLGIEELRQDLEVLDKNNKELHSNLEITSFFDKMANYCQISLEIKMKHFKAGTRDKQRNIDVEEENCFNPNGNGLLNKEIVVKPKNTKERKRNENKENLPRSKIQNKLRNNITYGNSANTFIERNEHTTKITKSKRRKLLSMSVLNGENSDWSEYCK